MPGDLLDITLHDELRQELELTVGLIMAADESEQLTQRDIDTVLGIRRNTKPHR